MNKEVEKVIIDFLYLDHEMDFIIEEAKVEEVDLDFYIEEISQFEVTVLDWIEEEISGLTFNEGSVPLDINCVAVYAESSMRMRKVNRNG